MINRLSESGVLDAIPDAAGPSPAPPRSAGDSVAAWLDIAMKLCRLTPRESAGLREELESHLTERVNDLLVIGLSERDGIRQAISELGDAALFAQGYRSERNEPTRRRIMNGMLIGGVTAALALSVTAVRMNQPDRAANTYPSGSAYVQPGELSSATVSAAFTEAPLSDVLSTLGRAADGASYVHWSSLARRGEGPDTKVTLDVGEVTIPRAISMLNEVLEMEGESRIEYRVAEGLIEFATREYFDRRERLMVAYETEDFLRFDVDVQEAADALTVLAEPASWVDNGGETASQLVVGTLIFVNAPPRIQAQVQWVFNQLSVQGEQDALLDERADPATAVGDATEMRIESIGDRVRITMAGPGGDSVIMADHITLSGRITSMSDRIDGAGAADPFTDASIPGDPVMAEPANEAAGTPGRK